MVKQTKGFNVKIGQTNLPFLHSANEGESIWGGRLQAYYVDPAYVNCDMGINYTVLNGGMVRADFICYNVPSFIPCRNADKGDMMFNSEKDMIDSFKSWLKSISKTKTVKKSKKDIPIMKRELEL